MDKIAKFATVMKGGTSPATAQFNLPQYPSKEDEQKSQARGAALLWRRRQEMASNG